MLHRLILTLGVAAMAIPAVAQEAPPARLINVMGVGIDRTAPDIATLEFSIRGEGDNADAAASALAARQKALASGLLGLLGTASELSMGNVLVTEVRDRACIDGRPYGGPVALSRGVCTVVGYAASIQGQVRTRAVDKIGTAAGLAARLGASEAHVGGFALADPEAAQRRAAAVAMRDARQRAETAAQGAGVRLGELASIRDQGASAPGSDIILRAAAPSAPPPPPPPPIEIGVKPRPIETRAQMLVSFEIAR